MRKLVFLIIPLLVLSACASPFDNPLSSLGIMSQKKESIDYSPRPPLAIPPEEQRSQLPPPQPATQMQGASVQEVTITPPPSYDTPAPVPQNVEPPKDDVPWWVNPFGS